jgi:predicted ABC-type ATPase
MKRLRIFAGPNGSGKSTLFKQLQGQFSLGYYLNPDDLYQVTNATRMLDLEAFSIISDQREWRAFWQGHGLFGKATRLSKSYIENNVLVFGEVPQSYEASILSDFLRHKLLSTGQTFSFETVFSHPTKLEFMQKARKAGYKCYLYFAAVSSPDISVARVRQRTQEGGHDVPEDKIRERYERTLENLATALTHAHRAYLFDNSTDMKLVAELSPNGSLELGKSPTPVWLETHVLRKLIPAP